MIPIVSIVVFLVGSTKLLHETFTKVRGCGVNCVVCKKCLPNRNSR